VIAVPMSIPIQEWVVVYTTKYCIKIPLLSVTVSSLTHTVSKCKEPALFMTPLSPFREGKEALHENWAMFN
jgi:hypothetical protein